MSRFPIARISTARFFLLLALIIVPREFSDLWKPMWPINDLMKIKQKKLRNDA